MKKVFYLFVAMIAILTVSSCHSVSPDADEECVLIKKPWIFGHGGVDDTPVQTGCTWCVWTTSSETFKITPQRYDVEFNDIFSNDNTPLDYATYLVLQIEAGKTPILLKNYGVDWFKNNIEAKYRNFVRDEVSKYSPFDLMSNREVCQRIDSAVTIKTNKYLAELSANKELPVKCLSIITGRAKPNPKQLNEMDNTAAAIQEKVTQDRKAEMYESKRLAEIKRAEADNAYMKEMNLSTEQYIMLKLIEKGNPNIDVLLGGGASSMWNIKR